MASEWRKVSLGEIFKVKHGFAFKGEFFTDEPQDTVLVTPGNFAIGGGFQDGKRKYYKGPVPEDYVLKPGQVVVTMTDLSKESDTLGYAASVPSDSTTWLHNQRVGLLEFNSTIPTSPRFVQYLLRMHEYRSWVVGSATGTTVKHTSPGRIESFTTHIPPIEEQHAIAHILGTLDDKIELLRKQNETLEAMARTLFKAWFVDFEPVRAKVEGRWQRGQSLPGLPAHLYDLFPDRLLESELGEIPQGWEVKKIGDVITRLSVGKKYEQKTVSSEGCVPVLDQGKSGIIGYHNDEPGVAATADAPVVVFANHTCYMRLISFSFSAIQNVLPFIGKDVSTIWAYYATFGKQSFVEYKGHWPDFVIHDIAIPPSNLTEQFAKLAHDNLKLIWENERESRALVQLRDTLLPKLISGELRVPDAERIVGAAV